MAITITNSQSHSSFESVECCCFFVTGALGHLDLEVTIFRNFPRIYKALKHAALNLFSQMWSRRDLPNHPLQDVILKSAGDKIPSEVPKRCF